MFLLDTIRAFLTQIASVAMRLFLSKTLLSAASGVFLVSILVLSPHSVLTNSEKNHTAAPSTNEAPKAMTASISPSFLSNCPVPVDLKQISSLSSLSESLRALLIECETGGIGTESCSESIGIGPISDSCSTSCKDGYYACCNDSIWSGATCDCIMELS